MLKNKFSALILFLVFVLSCMTSVFAEPNDIYMENSELTEPQLKSEAAMLVDMKTGRVLYSKNADEQKFPASTTKIMTAILALEYGNLNDIVTANITALSPITNEDSHMGILIGEQLTLEQLLYGMLVYSANDAANVIATHIGGTPENFVDLMNQKAEEMGLSDTHFANAYGIHDDNHYTTARDMVTMARYAMQNEKFREIVKTPIYKIPPTEKYTSERNLPNTNLFVSSYRSAEFYNKNVTGIKTGSTSAAGYCLVTSAQTDGTELLTVVFKAPNKSASYTDSKALLDLGFKNYAYQQIATAGESVHDSKKVKNAVNDTCVALTVSEDIGALLPKDINVTEAIEVVEENIPKEIKAPIKKGDVLGSITYLYNGEEIGKTSLVALNDVERNTFLFILDIITTILTSWLFWIPAVLIIALLIIRNINIKKQKRLEQKKRLLNAQKRANEGQRPTRPDRYTSSDARKNQNSRYKR